MSDDELLTRLGLALAIGFLIGAERGWRQRDAGEGARTAGLRTFTLIGFAGGIFALLVDPLGPGVFIAGFAAVVAVVAALRWRSASIATGGFGATTVVAAIVTFALGGLAVLGSMVAAAAAAVVVTVILAAKGWLHAWMKTLTWEELRAALILFAMTFVLLPVLPDRGFGPYEALNPRSLWLMTIAIAGVSFMGYVAVKVAGARYGPLIAGIAGGVVSSTITTVDLARRARLDPQHLRTFLAGALAASATMFVRVTTIVAVFGPSLVVRIVGPLAVAFVITVASAVALDRPWQASAETAPGEPSKLRNPFDLATVLFFGLLLAIVMLLSAILTANFGEGGGIAFAAVAGISDVDAITLSMTQVIGEGFAPGAAALAILVAVAANSISKAVLATVTGGPRFGLMYFAVSAASLVAGGVALLLIPVA